MPARSTPSTTARGQSYVTHDEFYRFTEDVKQALSEVVSSIDSLKTDQYGIATSVATTGKLTGRDLLAVGGLICAAITTAVTVCAIVGAMALAPVSRTADHALETARSANNEKEMMSVQKDLENIRDWRQQLAAKEAALIEWRSSIDQSITRNNTILDPRNPPQYKLPPRTNISND